MLNWQNDRVVSGGNACCAKYCYNNKKNSSQSFFRFPSNPVRARVWALAAGRSDLLKSCESLCKSHRICGIHFEKKLFKKNIRGSRKILMPKAVPTLFPSLDSSSKCEDHNYCQFLIEPQSYVSHRSSVIEDHCYYQLSVELQSSDVSSTPDDTEYEPVPPKTIKSEPVILQNIVVVPGK